MKKLKIGFVNMPYDLDINDNVFTWILRNNYDIEIDNIEPNIIFSCDNMSAYKNSIKIYFNGEPSIFRNNYSSDINLMQYDITDDKTCIRFPLYLYYIADFIKRKQITSLDFFFQNKNGEEILKQKSKFCAFVSSGPFNGVGQYRDSFVQKLMKYKKVDCPGTRFNNVSRIPGSSNHGLNASFIKREFLKPYKFTISFEPHSIKDGYNGYTSEKLIDPMYSNSLPLYWGNVLIQNEFNTKSFLNFHDYENEEEFIEKIIQIDTDDNLYIQYMNEPWTYENKYLDMNFLVEIFKKIIDDKI